MSESQNVRLSGQSTLANGAPAMPAFLRNSVENDDAGAGGDKDKSEKKVAGTFVDAAAMKEQVRLKLYKPKYNVCDLYYDYGIFPYIATSPKFDKLTLVIIFINAIWISVDTDGNKADVLINAEARFQIAENLFCFFFSFEWFVRFMSFRRKRDGFRDAWFVFDSVMVLAMVLETWFLSAYMLFIAQGASGGNTGFLKIAKLFRLSRMARMARLMRAMPEMMILIRGMLAATRSVFFTLCLLVVIIYVFAVLFVQITEGTDVGQAYFKDVPSAMFTLLIRGCLLDSVSYVAYDFVVEPFYLNLFFFLFVLLSAFTLMNMLIGVLVEVVSAVASVEKEEMTISYVKERLERVVDMIDLDGGRSISKNEFMQILGYEEAVRCLHDVGVDAIGLVDFADFIFQKDDEEDEQDIELEFPDFMDVVLQFRGTNPASVKDIVDLRKFIHTEIKQMRQIVVNQTSAWKEKPMAAKKSLPKASSAPSAKTDGAQALSGQWEPVKLASSKLSQDSKPQDSSIEVILSKLQHESALPASFKEIPTDFISGDGNRAGAAIVESSGNRDKRFVNGVPPPWIDAPMDALWKRVGDRVAMIIDDQVEIRCMEHLDVEKTSYGSDGVSIHVNGASGQSSARQTACNVPGSARI